MDELEQAKQEISYLKDKIYELENKVDTLGFQLEYAKIKGESLVFNIDQHLSTEQLQHSNNYNYFKKQSK